MAELPFGAPQRIVATTSSGQSHILAALNTPGGSNDFPNPQNRGPNPGPPLPHMQMRAMGGPPFPPPQGPPGPGGPPQQMRAQVYQFPPGGPQNGPPQGPGIPGGGGGPPPPHAPAMVRMLNTPTARPPNPVNGQVNLPPPGARVQVQVVGQGPSGHHPPPPMHHPAPSSSVGHPPPQIIQHTVPTAGGASIIDKNRLDEFVKQIDPSAVLEEVVKTELAEYLDSFVDELVDRMCRVVQHRGDRRIKASDVEFILDAVCNLPHTPRVGSEPRPTAAQMNAANNRNPAIAAHQQRLALIRKTLKKF